MASNSSLKIEDSTKMDFSETRVNSSTSIIISLAILISEEWKKTRCGRMEIRLTKEVVT